ncbi:unnamed protein product, partial [Heterotrigona itama]
MEVKFCFLLIIIFLRFLRNYCTNIELGIEHIFFSTRTAEIYHFPIFQTRRKAETSFSSIDVEVQFLFLHCDFTRFTGILSRTITITIGTGKL